MALAPSTPPQVAILHAADEEPWALWLREQTAHLGFTVHAAAHDLRPGADRVAFHETSLAAPRVLALLTHRALLDRRFVGALNAAIEGMHTGQTTLIPVVFEPRDDLPALLGAIEPLSFVLVDEAEALRRLAFALGVLPAGNPAPYPGGVQWPGRNPFPGLAAFGLEQAAIFGGRGPDIECCLAHLAQRPWLRIEGASGHGKSSLARAGVSSALAEGRGGFDPHHIAVIRPSAQPLLALARTLARLTGRPASEIHAELWDGPDSGLVSVLRERLDRPLALLIDQFEEALRGGRDVDELARLDALLAEALPTGRLRLITTLRSDHAPRIGQMPALAARLQTHSAQHLLLAMNAAALHEALDAPLAHHGLAWPEAALPERIVADALDRQRAGSGDLSAALPLVAHVAHALWARRKDGREPRPTLVGYLEMGGVIGALAESADRCLDALDEPRRHLALRLLLRLVRPGRGTADARAPMARDALLRSVRGEGGHDADDETIDGVLRHLSGASQWSTDGEPHAPPRLVTVSRTAGGAATVELIHEALLTGWPRLREALDAQRKVLERRADRRAAAARWHARGRDPGWLPTAARLQWLHGSDLNGREQQDLAAGADGIVADYLDAARVELDRLADAQRSTLEAMESARVLADKAVTEALAVARTIRQTVDHRLPGLPGAAGVRRELLAESARLIASLRTAANDREDLARGELYTLLSAARVALSQDRTAAALEAGLHAVELARERNQRSTADSRRDLAIALECLAMAHRRDERVDLARALLADSLALREALAGAEPSDFALRWDVARCHARMGALAMVQRDWPRARAAFACELDALDRLVELDHRKTDVYADIGSCLVNRLRVADRTHDLTAALAAASAIQRRLAAPLCGSLDEAPRAVAALQLGRVVHRALTPGAAGEPGRAWGREARATALASAGFHGLAAEYFGAARRRDPGAATSDSPGRTTAHDPRLSAEQRRAAAWRDVWRANTPHDVSLAVCAVLSQQPDETWMPDGVVSSTTVETTLRAIVRRRPYHARYTHALAWVLALRQQLDDSERLLLKARALGAGSLAFLHLHLAEIRRRRGDAEGARRAYEEAIAQAGDHETRWHIETAARALTPADAPAR